VNIPKIATTADVLSAALAYAAAGLMVGPLTAGSKNPGSILGKGWPTRTSDNAEVIAGWFAGCADGTGIFLHAGACGLVIFDVDHPENVPKWLWEHLDLAPFQRTREDGSPRRGHYVFRVPPGHRLGNSTGRITGIGGRGWGEVRGANGVIVVTPTRHREAGGRYRWVRIGEIPFLPDEVAQALPDADGARDIASKGEVEQFLDYCTTAQAGPFASRAILSMFAAEVTGGSGRHDACVRAACWIVREAAAGRFPARPVLGELRAQFLARFDEQELRRRDAAGEFDRVVGFAVGQLTAARIAEVRARHDTSAYDGPGDGPEPGPQGPTKPSAGPMGPPPGGGGDLWPGRKRSGAARERTAPAVTGSAGLANLPQEVWGTGAALGVIRAAALSRVLSPDAVLGCVLARLSAFIRPSVRVDTGLGRASLNLAVVVVGDSSAGKSEAWRCARELLPVPGPLPGMPDNDGLPLGSGEGMAEAFYGMVEELTGETYLSGPRKGEAKTKLVRKKMYDHALFFADEGEALVRMMERSGTTIASEIRKAWKAETLGQANASVERRRIVPDGEYALGMVLGFQPGTIGPLFDDAAGGTPQRFLFVSAHSDDVSDGGAEGAGEAGSWPGGLRNVGHMLPTGDLELPDAARVQLRAARVAARRVGAAPSGLNGHWPLHRAKLAALLAVLDLRDKITEADWELTRVLWETSCGVRDGLVNAFSARRAARRAAEDDRAVTVAARSAVASEQAAATAAMQRVARRVAEMVHDRGVRVVGGKAGVRQAIASRDRGWADEAMAEAAARGWVVVSGNTIEPGPKRPDK